MIFEEILRHLITKQVVKPQNRSFGRWALVTFHRSEDVVAKLRARISQSGQAFEGTDTYRRHGPSSVCIVGSPPRSSPCHITHRGQHKGEGGCSYQSSYRPLSTTVAAFVPVAESSEAYREAISGPRSYIDDAVASRRC